jgi:hypothetical protein
MQLMAISPTLPLPMRREWLRSLVDLRRARGRSMFAANPMLEEGP